MAIVYDTEHPPIKERYEVGEVPPGNLALRKEYHEAKAAGKPYYPSGYRPEPEMQRLAREVAQERALVASAAAATSTPSPTQPTRVETQRMAPQPISPEPLLPQSEAIHQVPPRVPANERFHLQFDTSDAHIGGPAVVPPKAKPLPKTAMQKGKNALIVGAIILGGAALTYGKEAWAARKGSVKDMHRAGAETAGSQLTQLATVDGVIYSAIGFLPIAGTALAFFDGDERRQRIQFDPNLSPEEKHLQLQENLDSTLIGMIPVVGPLLAHITARSK